MAHCLDHCHVRPGITGQASPYLGRSRSFPTHSSYAARPPAHWPRFGSALPTRRNHLGIAPPRHLPRLSPPWRAPASSRAPRARTGTGTPSRMSPACYQVRSAPSPRQPRWRRLVCPGPTHTCAPIQARVAKTARPNFGRTEMYCLMKIPARTVRYVLDGNLSRKCSFKTHRTVVR